MATKVAGDVQVAGQGTPPPAESVVVPRRVPVRAQAVETLPDVPERSLSDLYAEFGATLEGEEPETPTAPEAPEEGSEDETPEEEPEDDTPSESEESDEDEEAAPAPAGVEAWADVIREKPVRINEVPARDRAKVIETALAQQKADSIAAAQRAYDLGKQQAALELETRQAVAEIDQLKADDPQAYVEWADQYPDRDETYRAFKRQQASPQGDAGVTALRTAARAALSKLEGESLERVRAGGPYPETPEGLAKLQDAVVEELATVRVQATARAQAPTREAAEKRETAAARLKGTPKPSAGKGGTGDGELTLDVLKTLSQEEHMKLASTPEGRARVERALAGG